MRLTLNLSLKTVLAAALLLPLAACLPAAVAKDLSAAKAQHKTLAAAAKLTKKALKKKKDELEAARVGYDRIVAAMAQINEVLIQAASEAKPDAENPEWAKASAEYNSAKDDFFVYAKGQLEANGYGKKAPVLTGNFDPQRLWLEYLKLSPSKREGSIEDIAAQLALTPWDNL